MKTSSRPRRVSSEEHSILKFSRKGTEGASEMKGLDLILMDHKNKARLGSRPRDARAWRSAIIHNIFFQ